MKTNNPVLDTLVESQTQFINNWMESAKKMQSAFASGSIASEGQSLYKEYFDKQMNVLNNMQRSAAGMFGAAESGPQQFFRDWFDKQATYAKQMGEFAQNLQNSFNNPNAFGRPAQDFMSSFGQSGQAYSNLYNSWLNTLNSTYETLSRNMQGSFNRDVFSNYMAGNQVYVRMQEFFQPMAEAFRKGQFNYEAFRGHFSAENYQNLVKQMFGGLFTEASIREVYDSAIRQLQQFFAGQQNLSKEYFEQMQKVRENLPQLFSNPLGNGFGDLYRQMENVFGKTFEPLMKIVSPGKEKEQAEAIIALMDKMAGYSIRQAELQSLLAATAQKSVEEVAKRNAEKFAGNGGMQTPSAQELYSEWVKVNEEMFTTLFSSEEFSRLKADTLNLSLEARKLFEKQFEETFRQYPIVFKSEVEELYQTIYELKKQVKELKAKLIDQELAEPAGEEKRKKK